MYSVTSTPKLVMKVLCFVFAVVLIAGGSLMIKMADEEIEKAKPVDVKYGVIIDGEYKVTHSEKGFGNPEWQESMKGARVLAQVAIVIGIGMGIGGLFIKTKVTCTY